MIVFDLSCPAGHRFEGWFASSQDYASQCERGLVSCPRCGSDQIGKAPMAPAVPRKGNRQASAGRDSTGGERRELVAGGKPPPEVMEAMARLAAMQAEALKSSHWVGSKFAEESRAMHYGESEAKPIHGQATPEEARELHEEGIPLMPVLFPVAPPDDIN